MRVGLCQEGNRLEFTRLRAPGRAEPLGTITRPTLWVEVSKDMRRAMVITRETRGDVWMSRVVRR